MQEVSERRVRYKLDECISKSSYLAIDPRLPALYAEAPDHVGIEGPKEGAYKVVDGGGGHVVK